MDDIITCDICYYNNKLLYELSCCNNTKKICQDCLDSLQRRYCPYCREKLDDNLFTQKGISRSLPERFTWDDYFAQEMETHIEEYSSNLEQNSRILRRQVNRMRRRYLTEINTRNRLGNTLTSRERRDSNRRSRRQLRNYSRNVRNRININNDIDDEIFTLELES